MRKKASDFDPQVLSLFDRYVHGLISRRDFIDRASKVTVGMSGLAALEALSPNFAAAQQIKPDDTRLKAEFVEIPAPGYGKVRAYRVAPAKPKGKLPVVLVVHENRGLNPHIEDIARRIALDNFIAFAPDALFPLGGYPGDEDKARELFQTLDQDKTRQDFVATAHYLKKLPEGNGKLGTVGFCYGGGIVNYLATQVPELNAGVPFYGVAPKLEDVPNIKAHLLLNFAENDERVNASWPPYENALKQAHVKYEAFVYPGTQHGFNNDTTPRYDEKAAKLAWDRTIKFFEKNLK
jgi:carboxymethylenebutenolidase